MSLLKTATEGGQIWAHRVRMTKQVVRFAMLASIVASFVYFAYQMSCIPTVYYQSAWYYAKALYVGGLEEKVLVDGEFWGKVMNKQFPKHEIAIKSDKVEKTCKLLLGVLFERALFHLKKSAAVFFLFFSGFIVFFLIKGLKARKKELVSGQTTVSPWAISLRLRLIRKASSVKIGFLPLVKGTETCHILISGGTGSGKTNCFHSILPQIRKAKQRAVVVDSTGEFVSKYYREGKDILMNPFDKRGVKWHPWCECKDSFDYKSLAQSFIPSSYQEDENFWRKAEQVFCAILQVKMEEHHTSGLTNSYFIPL